MKDYYCTNRTQQLLNKFTPQSLEEEIQVLYNEEDSDLIPFGYKVIRNELDDTRYIISLEDFRSDSPLQEVAEDQLETVEYFEHGIPSWLKPLPAFAVYLAEWNGQEWQLTKVSGL